MNCDDKSQSPFSAKLSYFNIYNQFIQHTARTDIREHIKKSILKERRKGAGGMNPSCANNKCKFVSDIKVL